MMVRLCSFGLVINNVKRIGGGAVRRLAVLGVLASIELSTRSETAKELVSSHMPIVGVSFRHGNCRYRAGYGLMKINGVSHEDFVA